MYFTSGSNVTSAFVIPVLMLQKKPFFCLPVLLFLAGLTSCAQQTGEATGYLLKVCDSSYEYCGYIDMKGDTVIPAGRYVFCFTDTFRNYAVVADSKGFLAIDRKGKELYKVFAFDNAPDEPSDGLFRIQQENKIGYADAISGEIVISPQFYCAHPFENGVARVAIDCETQPRGEHWVWISGDWFYINRTGKRVKSVE